MDWLAEIAPRDTINAVRADLGRLQDHQKPLVLRRDRYVDLRRRDDTERADREFAVLLVFYLAEKWEEKAWDLLERLGIGTSFSAFEKWRADVPQQERDLMIAAGLADREARGLPLAQQKLMKSLPRCLAVLNRRDATLFPDLAGLSDEDMVRKLFDRAQRRRHFARSKQPPERSKSSGRPPRKPRKRLKKTSRNTL
jgi:hypothetical protein